MNKFLKINCLSLAFLLLSASIASATRWVYIGTSNDTDFYVDVDNERVDGPFWAAPIRSENRNGTFLGEVLVDCRDNSYKTAIGNQVYDWQRIEPGSPLSTVVKTVCY